MTLFGYKKMIQITQSSGWKIYETNYLYKIYSMHSPTNYLPN